MFSVTPTLSRSRPAAVRREVHGVLPWSTRGGDTALDLAVVVLATWTVVYHLCLLLRLSVPWAVALEVGALAGWGLVSRRAHHRVRDVRRTPASMRATGVGTAAILSSNLEQLLVAGAVASGVATAVLVAVDTSWPAVAALWLTSALAGTGWAVLRLRWAPVVGPRGR